MRRDQVNYMVGQMQIEAKRIRDELLPELKPLTGQEMAAVLRKTKTVNIGQLANLVEKNRELAYVSTVAACAPAVQLAIIQRRKAIERRQRAMNDASAEARKMIAMLESCCVLGKDARDADGGVLLERFRIEYRQACGVLACQQPARG